MKNPPAPLVIAVLLAAVPAPAQEPPAAVPATPDWRMPFRSPQSNLVPPEEMWRALKPMYEIARRAPAGTRSFDQNGVEVIEDAVWQGHLAALLEKPMDAGYLSLVIRDCLHVSDRAIAFYGSFYLPHPAVVLQMIEHIPGEPSRTLREDAYVRAVEFLRVHLPAIVPGDLSQWTQTQVARGETKPPRPGDYAYGFDPAPFVALLALDDSRDHEQALWFFARCAEIRPEFGMRILDMARAHVDRIVAGSPSRARAAAIELVAALDPDRERSAPADDADATALAAWYAAVIHDLFPPIRRVSEGLIVLYDGEDIDALVRIGAAALRDGSLGTDDVNGRTKAGGPFRGYRLETLPEPLDQLGLETGFTITAVNGMPVSRGDRILALLERALPRTRSFLVEFVDKQGTARAIEYRRH